MGDFTRKPLGVLDNLYRFVGGQTGPNRFAEDMDIQPVHDLSREAELGNSQTGDNGYFNRGFGLAHVGTGTLFGTADIYARTFKNLDPFDVDIWAIDALCNINDAGDFASAACGIEYPVSDGFGDSEVKIVREFTTPTVALFTGGLIPVPPVDDFCVLPLYVPHGSLIGVTSTSDNSGTVTVRTLILFWAGARGTTPPGMM